VEEADGLNSTARLEALEHFQDHPLRLGHLINEPSLLLGHAEGHVSEQKHDEAMRWRAMREAFPEKSFWTETYGI
jgi:hypothetical protein